MDEYGYVVDLSYAFQGSYDGGDKTVSGIYIDSSERSQGLFGFIYDASIENLGIETSFINGADYTGGLVGYSQRGKVINCFFTGTVNGKNYVGGLIGYNFGGIVSGCHNAGFVVCGPHSEYVFSNTGGIVGGNNDGIVEYCENRGTVAGDYQVGGIVGENWSNAIFRCQNFGVVYGRRNAVGGIAGSNLYGLIRSDYNNGTVTADGEKAGGIAGENIQGQVEDCYNTADVEGSKCVGGVVGVLSNGYLKTSHNTGYVEGGDFLGGIIGKMTEGNVEACYYLDTSVQGHSNTYGTKLTAEQMSHKASFTGFDFVNVWAIEPDADYPRFIYELPPESGGASAVWDGTATEGFARGDGTKENPYIIEDAAQLAYLAKTVNEGNSYAGKYIKLDNEIILNRKDVPNWTLNASPWTPIGADSPFEGYFDGNGYTIRGVYIDSVRYDQGIFGHNKGTVINLGVEPYFIRGNVDVAGVVAYNDGGYMDNCYNIGPVYGRWGVGGVVGYNEDGIVRYCFNEGAVFGYETAGGVAGGNDEGIVTDCYNTGKVGGTWVTGGVVGYVEDGTTRESYNMGDVSGIYRVGGVVGDSEGSMLIDCYNLGSVSGIATVGGIFGYGNLSRTITSYNRGTVTAFDSFGGLAGQEYECIVTDCYYLDTAVTEPDINIGKALTEAEMLLAESYKGFDFENVWALISGDSYHPYPQFLRYLDPAPGEPSAVWDGSISEFFADGDGSEDAPYLIKTAEQLAFFAYSVNNGIDFSGEFIKLENDILLNDVTEDKWILNATKWTPIGLTGEFRGTFDGDGHVISGVYIDEGTENSGFFTTNYGTIKNVGIIGAYIKGTNNLGGVVGLNLGTVDGCFFDGTLSGNNAVGGVVGRNEGILTNSYNMGNVIGATDTGGVLGVSYSEEGSFSGLYNTGRVLGVYGIGGVAGRIEGISLYRCYNIGNINGCYKAGGIVGDVMSGSLTYCYNTGNVSGSELVGGLVGYGEYCYLTEVFNKGEITGDYSVGGIIGESSWGSISDGYNAGSILGQYYVGGIGGYSTYYFFNCVYNVGTVSGDNAYDFGALTGKGNGCDYYYSYYLDTSAPGAVYSRGTALTEPEMQDKDSLEGFDFETIWDVDREADYLYPTLRNLTGTPAEPIAVTGISLDKSTLTLNVGDTGKINATVEPANAYNKTVSWTSADESIATVSQSGVVTAVAPGTVTITATTVDGGFTATCAVTVLLASVTGVSLNKASLSLKQGKTATLIATVQPENAHNKAVTWSTSDESVATVDNGGLVTAVSPGAAVITVTTVDGGFTATCSVTVEPNVVTEIIIDKPTLTLKAGESGQLTAVVEPADAVNKDIIWTSSNEAVATVDANGVVTAVGVGTATITARTVDGSVVASCTVTVEPVKVTGISLDKTSLSIKIYEKATLNATVKPANATNKNVTWRSSDNSVAEVSANGVVTAKKVGTAKISATTADGGYAAVCTVTVTKDEITIKSGTGYAINKNDTILYRVKPGTTVDELLKNLQGGNLEVRNSKGERLSGGSVVSTGDVVNLIVDGKVIDTLLISVLGDVNGDGKVTAADGRLVLRHAAKIQTLTELQMLSAEVDGKEGIWVTDARVILRVVAKLETF